MLTDAMKDMGSPTSTSPKETSPKTNKDKVKNKTQKKFGPNTLRNDVLNKAILRMIKKYYKTAIKPYMREAKDLFEAI